MDFSCDYFCTRIVVLISSICIFMFLFVYFTINYYLLQLNKIFKLSAIGKVCMFLKFEFDIKITVQLVKKQTVFPRFLEISFIIS